MLSVACAKSIINMRASIILLITLTIQTVGLAQTWSWELVESTSTEVLNDVFFIDASTGWIVGQKATILSTKNGGESWESIDNIEGLSENDLLSVFFLDSLNGWISGVGSTFDGPLVMNTTDGGESWTVLAVESTGNTRASDIAFRNDSTGWLVTFTGVVLGTEDSGVTWVEEETRPASSTSVSQLEEVSVSENRAFVGGRLTSGPSSKKYALLDRISGDNPFWFGDSSPEVDRDDQIYTVTLLNDSIGFAGGLNGNIYKLESKINENWSKVYQVPEGASFIRSISFPDAENGWALANTTDALQGTSYRTTDGGDTWRALPNVDGPMVKMTAVANGNSFNAWLVGRDGKIFKGSEGTSSVQNLSSVTDISVYPNPVADKLTATLETTSNEKLVIELYSSNGRRVQLLFDGMIQQGTTTLEFSDIINPPPGTYFLTVRNENGAVRSVPVIFR